MKKIILFIIVTILTISVNSCSKDDSNAPNPNTMGAFKCKINGTYISFYNVTAIDGDDGIWVSVWNGGKPYVSPPTEVIAFTVKQDAVGTDALVTGSLNYMKNMVPYSPDTKTINVNVTSNNYINHILKGTFSGNFKTTDGNNTVKITEGTFDISY